MQTTLDIDETLLRQLEQQARQQGKPLAALLEQALLGLVSRGATEPSAPAQNEIGLPLADDDPFFGALEEIRLLGRISTRREIELP